MDDKGNIYLTEGEPPEEDRRRLEEATKRDAEGIDARIRKLLGSSMHNESDEPSTEPVGDPDAGGDDESDRE